MTTLRRRLLATSTVALAVLSMGACSRTNFSAQTNQQYQAAEGANLRGEIDAMNTVVVADPDGDGVISAGVVSQIDDVDSIADITIDGPEGPLEVVREARSVLQVPAKGIVTLGSDAETKFVVEDAGSVAGRYVTITITYQNSEATVIEAPVVERSETYSSVVPA